MTPVGSRGLVVFTASHRCPHAGHRTTRRHTTGAPRLRSAAPPPAPRFSGAPFHRPRPASPERRSAARAPLLPRPASPARRSAGAPLLRPRVSPPAPVTPPAPRFPSRDRSSARASHRPRPCHGPRPASPIYHAATSHRARHSPVRHTSLFRWLCRRCDHFLGHPEPNSGHLVYKGCLGIQDSRLRGLGEQAAGVPFVDVAHDRGVGGRAWLEDGAYLAHECQCGGGRRPDAQD